MTRAALALFPVVALLPRAGGAQPAEPAPSGVAPATPAAAAPAPPAGAATAGPADTDRRSGRPADAEEALHTAEAAYEFGDMKVVVDSARLIVEGELRANTVQRVQALKFLGIGLFLTDRRSGAESAFFELLRLEPRSRLNPTATRPDVVAFFERVRAGHDAELRRIRQSMRPSARKSFWKALLPPWGQLQNGHAGKGITLGAVEILSLGTALYTKNKLDSWVTQPGNTYGDHTETARTYKSANGLAVGVLGAAYVVGVIDAVAYFDDEPAEKSVTLLVSPDGTIGVGGRF